jgi:hypothetical protein
MHLLYLPPDANIAYRHVTQQPPTASASKLNLLCGPTFPQARKSPRSSFEALTAPTHVAEVRVVHSSRSVHQGSIASCVEALNSFACTLEFLGRDGHRYALDIS